MKKILIALLLSITYFIACNNSEESEINALLIYKVESLSKEKLDVARLLTETE